MTMKYRLSAFTHDCIHPVRTPVLLDLPFFALLIQSETPAARAHICAVAFLHFLLVSAPAAGNITHDVPD